jgi:nucleoside-diphosphate kinase
MKNTTTSKKMIIAMLVILASVSSFFLYKKVKNNYLVANKEITLAIIKPDAVSAKNSGKIIDLIEQNGFEILGLEKINLSQDRAEKFYAVHKDRSFFKDLVKFMSEGPVVVIALSKENAVADWRKLMGETNPEKAEAGTMRKLFGTNIQRNATHGSDSVENAKNEVKFFFPDIKVN